MLINPLMSCSARLPVYLLLTGVFFPKSAGSILFLLYLSGIILAVLVARLFKRFLFKSEDVPFVMELPPYRMPTMRSTIIHMWDKGKQFLKKMGGVILVASIIIWFLSYFPRETSMTAFYDNEITQIESSSIEETLKESQINEINRLKSMDHQQNSYIGKIGKTIEPALKPLGFDWRMSVSLLAGMSAKEVVVSVLSILYTGGDDDGDEQQLSERLSQTKDADGNLVFTPLVALSFMFFVLIYFPCMATVAAVIKESGSWKWGVFLIVYTCSLAWIVSFLIYQIGSIFT